MSVQYATNNFPTANKRLDDRGSRRGKSSMRATKKPGRDRLCGNERLRRSGASFLWGQARLALRPDAPTRLIARRMLYASTVRAVSALTLLIPVVRKRPPAV